MAMMVAAAMQALYLAIYLTGSSLLLMNIWNTQ